LCTQNYENASILSLKRKESVNPFDADTL